MRGLPVERSPVIHQQPLQRTVPEGVHGETFSCSFLFLGGVPDWRKCPGGPIHSTPNSDARFARILPHAAVQGTGPEVCCTSTQGFRLGQCTRTPPAVCQHYRYWAKFSAAANGQAQVEIADGKRLPSSSPKPRRSSHSLHGCRTGVCGQRKSQGGGRRLTTSNRFRGRALRW